MMPMRFTGFRILCEAPEPPKKGFEKSNMDGVLARDLNIVPGSNDKAMDMVSPGSTIQFKGNKLKSLNKIIGIDGDDVALKLIRVVKQNKFGVQIEDITGACDKDGLNTGREFGRFSDRPFPHAPCSPTSGKKWWISGKDWDNIRMPSAGAAGGGGGMGGAGGGMGGPPGGGMGGPPMPPPPGGGAGGPPSPPA